MITELEKRKLTRNFLNISLHFKKIIHLNFFQKQLLAQKMRLEIVGGYSGIKSRIQGLVGVGKAEKHPLRKNCSKTDATFTSTTSIMIDHFAFSYFQGSIE